MKARYGRLIGDWNVAQVQDFSFAFCDIVDENIGSCTTPNSPFKADFNEDITSWDTSAANSMEGLFDGLTDFNQDIGGVGANWRTSNVVSMRRTF